MVEGLSLVEKCCKKPEKNESKRRQKMLTVFWSKQRLRHIPWGVISSVNWQNYSGEKCSAYGIRLNQQMPFWFQIEISKNFHTHINTHTSVIVSCTHTSKLVYRKRVRLYDIWIAACSQMLPHSQRNESQTVSYKISIQDISI